MTLRLSYRGMQWFIVGWITLSTVLNLLCRQGLHILAPVLRQLFMISPESYSKIVSAFLLAYAAIYSIGGKWRFTASSPPRRPGLMAQ